METFWLIRDIGRSQVGQIDACHYFSVHHQQQAVAGKKLRQIRIRALAGNNFVHRIADSLEALQELNLTNDGRLIHIELRARSAQHADQVQEAKTGGRPKYAPAKINVRMRKSEILRNHERPGAFRRKAAEIDSRSGSAMFFMRLAHCF